jgi:hypothetical protein
MLVKLRLKRLEMVVMYLITVFDFLSLPVGIETILIRRGKQDVTEVRRRFTTRRIAT